MQNDKILGEDRSGLWEKIDLGPKVFFQFADQANDISWVKVAAGRGFFCSREGPGPFCSWAECIRAIRPFC